jgi:uncharacterized membrane protein
MISITHIHPMLIHFPIALVMLGFIADCAGLYLKKETSLSTMGFYLLLVGTVTALFALLSGIIFNPEMSGKANDIKETHEMFAWITLFTLVAASTLRIYLKIRNSENSNWKWLSFALFGLAAISVSVTGYLGGTLVYNYMMPL